MAVVENIDQGAAIARRPDFRARMLAQCDQIEQYKTAVYHTQGRRLSWDEAALEWIDRYAETFSTLDKSA